MFSFIITNIFFISFAVILFLVVRTLPRLDEPETVYKKNVLERWVTSGIPEKFDAASKAFITKVLRKSKVVLLKFDNLVTAKLKGITHENGNGKPKPDFKEITGEKAAEETPEN